MKMKTIHRRNFVKTLAGGAAVLTGASCATAPNRSTSRRSFTFAQLCDTQLGMGGYEHDVKTFRQAVRQINEMKPDFAMICGDLVNTPDVPSFTDFIAIKAGFDVPCYCTPGNHDVGAPVNPERLYYYRKAVGEDYYSFEHKGYTFVFVNAQLWKAPLEGESGPHDRWFAKTLREAAAKGNPIFVSGHYPLFINDPDEAEEYFNIAPPKRREILALFEECGVAAYLAGHTHKTIVNDYKGIQLVNGETTSKNFDERPMGFRLWRVEGVRPFECEFVALEGANKLIG